MEAPDLNKITTEILEKRLASIDLEIVEQGENINPAKLKELTIEKQRLVTRVATLKGEPIDKDTYDTSL